MVFLFFIVRFFTLFVQAQEILPSHTAQDSTLQSQKSIVRYGVGLTAHQSSVNGFGVNVADQGASDGTGILGWIEKEDVKSGGSGLAQHMGGQLLSRTRYHFDYSILYKWKFKESSKTFFGIRGNLQQQAWLNTTVTRSHLTQSQGDQVSGASIGFSAGKVVPIALGQRAWVCQVDATVGLMPMMWSGEVMVNPELYPNSDQARSNGVAAYRTGSPLAAQVGVHASVRSTDDPERVCVEGRVSLVYAENIYAIFSPYSPEMSMFMGNARIVLNLGKSFRIQGKQLMIAAHFDGLGVDMRRSQGIERAYQKLAEVEKKYNPNFDAPVSDRLRLIFNSVGVSVLIGGRQ